MRQRHRQGEKREEGEVEGRYLDLCLSVDFIVFGGDRILFPQAIDVAAGGDKDNEQYRIPGFQEEQEGPDKAEDPDFGRYGGDHPASVQRADGN